jgi:hypothetical protein
MKNSASATTDKTHCRAPCFDRVGCDRARESRQQIVLLFQQKVFDQRTCLLMATSQRTGGVTHPV